MGKKHSEQENLKMGDRRSEAGARSSDDEEEDPKWKAAIQSIATTTTYATAVNGLSNGTKTKSPELIASGKKKEVEEDGDYYLKPRKLKHYEIKAQKLLHEMLDKSLKVVRNPIHCQDEEPGHEGGVRLFKYAPVGIVFDHIDEIQGPTKKPKLLPRRGIDENSKQFRKQLKSLAVDGADIVAAAREACQKSLNRLEAKEAAAKEKGKKEEERVAELKRVRGERWLPSIAREMKLDRSYTKQA